MTSLSTTYQKGLSRRVSRRVAGGMLAACALYASVVSAALPAQQIATVPARPEQTMKISIIHDGKTLTGTMLDNPTARDFASLLPLALTLTDYASTEKISDLPRKLNRDEAPDAIAPVVGDITYYAPWGNLAIFHRDFRRSPGLIRLGGLDAEAGIFAQPGPMRVTIELADDERRR
jgi:hypothetical protein